MVKKARGGTFGAPNGPDAEEAAAKRWKQGPEQEPEHGAGAAAAAPLVPQPPAEPRERRDSASYAPGATLLAGRGQQPFSELDLRLVPFLIEAVIERELTDLFGGSVRQPFLTKTERCAPQSSHPFNVITPVLVSNRDAVSASDNQ